MGGMRPWTAKLLIAGLGGFLTMAATVSARAESVLRFAANTDIRVLDPIWSAEYSSRNHGYLIYDTLFAYNSKFEVKPQMVDTWKVSEDKLTYEFKLRAGLKWHDGQPVTADDCVASIKRWGTRDPIGQAMMAASSEIKSTGPDSFQIKFKEPFGYVLEALAKTGSPPPFMMPERIAKTSGTEQIKEAIGSGPFMFSRSEWAPGDKAVYLKFKDYKPRSEPADFLAGGKVAHVDRIEWLYIPSGATSVAALQAGDIDWVEHPPADLLPTLSKANGISVRAVDPFGIQTMIRFNHILPPFNDAKVRRAVGLTVDQKDYLRVMSDDPRSWETCRSVFICKTRFGEDVLTGDLLLKKDLAEAKKALAESSYRGEKIVILDAVDDAVLHALAIVAADNLKQIGMNVELRATDGASQFALSLKQDPIDKGGWSISPQFADSTNYSVPFLNNAMRVGGVGKASIGWPKNDKIEALRGAFLKATSLDDQKKIANEIAVEGYRDSIYFPTGQFKQLTAYRQAVSGIIDSPIPVFWNIKKQ